MRRPGLSRRNGRTEREIVLSTHLSSKYSYGGKLGVRERRKIKL